MPDRTHTVWVKLDKNGKIKLLYNSPDMPGLKKLKIHYHAPNKKGMGRSKGNSLERETAKAFSYWLYGNTKYMKRTPLSGGWASGKAGDIILDHEIQRKKKLKQPRIYVECRSYKDVLQHDILKWTVSGVPALYSKWIKEVEKKCDGRLPILVMKGKRTAPW